MDGERTTEHTIDPQGQSSLVDQVQTTRRTFTCMTKRHMIVVSIVIALVAIWGCFEAICAIGDHCFPLAFATNGLAHLRSHTTTPPPQGIWTSSELQTSRDLKPTLLAQTWKATVLTASPESGNERSRFSSPAACQSSTETSPSASIDTCPQTSQRSSPSTIHTTTSAVTGAASHVVTHAAQTSTASPTGASFATPEAEPSSKTATSTTAPQTSSPSRATTSGRESWIDASARDRPPPERYDANYEPGIETIPGIPENLTSFGQIEQWFTKPLPVAKLWGDLYLPMVTSSIADCASVAKDLMIEGASAVDGAIASQICHGFLNPVSAGIGGGSFMVVYDENRNRDIVFNAREAAPKTFDFREYERDRRLAKEGGRSIAIPGEISGFYRAWKQFGKVAWKRLFTRTIYWCEQGYEVTELLQQTISQNEAFLRRNAVLRDDYVVNGTLLRVGDKLRRRRLGHTLRRIAHDPISFYNGSLARDILLDVAEHGARWTASDLSDYQATISPALRYHLPYMGMTLLAPPPPSIGAMVGHALRVADRFNYEPNNWRPEVFYSWELGDKTYTVHQVLEAMKYAFALRDNIGDPTFNPDVKQFMVLSQDRSFAKEDKDSILNYAFKFRTYFKRLSADDPTPELTVDAEVLDAVQTSVVDKEGLRVSLTSSIGKGFGSQVVGRRTGIVFNNAMADFSTVNSTMFKKRVNWMAPGARPTSVMVPVILINSEFRAEATLGGTRGLRGVSSLIWTILNRYTFSAWFTEIQYRLLFHPDLTSNTIDAQGEIGWVRDEYLLELVRFGHRIRYTEHTEEAQVPSLMKVDGNHWFGLPFRRPHRGLLSYSGVA